LFRPSSDSTAHERQNTNPCASDDSMPETLRIIRPLPRTASGSDAGSEGSGADPCVTPEPAARRTNERPEDRAGDTECVGGSSPTDDAMAVPPELLALPDLRAFAPVPAHTRATDPVPNPVRPRSSGRTWRAVLWFVVALLALGSAVAVLIGFARH
jgi:hypothetical protein